MCDLPPNQIKLAREYVGHEITLTASGCRKPKYSNTNLVRGEDHNCVSVSDESIPLKLRQQIYDKEHGCVWLSACLLKGNIVNCYMGTLGGG